MLVLLQGNYEKSEGKSMIVNTETQKLEGVIAKRIGNVFSALFYFTDLKNEIEFGDEESARKELKSILTLLGHSETNLADDIKFN